MTDAENNTETEAAAKPESTPKKKAAAKPKAKAKAKPKTAAKTEAKNKTNTADVAPYKKSHSMPETSHGASGKRRSATTLTLLLVVAILIPTTIYKFNEELNSLPAQADSQENTADADTEPASTAMMQEKPESSASNDAETQSDTTPVQDTLPTNKNTHELAMAQAQERMTSSRELMQQRRQAYEKEMLLKQQEYKAIIEAHRQERAKIAERQKMEAQRIKQYHLETRKKVYEIQQQIFQLNEKIKQIMQESYTQRNP